MSLFGLILGGLFLVGCAAGDNSWDSSPVSEDSAEMVAAPEMDWDDEVAEEADWDDEVWHEDNDDMQEQEEAFGAIPILLPSDSGRQLSYDVDFILETVVFMPGVQLLWEMIGELGGYAEHERIRGRSIRHPDIERSAYFELRIPNEQLGTFIEFLATYYNIVDYARDLEDFTFAYERREANIDTLREQEQRILDALDGYNQDDEEDVRADLNDVQSQIRDLEQANAVIRRNVEYSEVTIRLHEIIIEIPVEEEPMEPPTFGERVQESLNATLSALSSTLQIMAIIFLTLLPWLLLIAVFVAPILYLVKRHNKRKKATPKKPAPENNSYGILKE